MQAQPQSEPRTFLLQSQLMESDIAKDNLNSKASGGGYTY